MSIQLWAQHCPHFDVAVHKGISWLLASNAMTTNLGVGGSVYFRLLPGLPGGRLPENAASCALGCWMGLRALSFGVVKRMWAWVRKEN